jgi:phytanoyl-CoA hydroxylase
MDGAIDQKFSLAGGITDDACAFFERHGFVHYEGFASSEEVSELRSGMESVERQWLESGRVKVNGIPIKFGCDVDGRPMVQRFAFTSLFSEAFHRFVNAPRFEAIREFVGGDCRVGEREKDGVVVNHYLNVKGSAYRRLGWHTDGLRDIFYLRRPQPMLNVGVYLDDSPKEIGGLRLIPGTHTQGIVPMVLRKPYFVSHGVDKREIAVEAKAGDLTIHDGRLWHRVALAKMEGAASRRRIMYVPFVTGEYQPKDESSKTPFYHRLQGVTRF